MPFDCTPVIDSPKQVCPAARRGPNTAVAVLTRARDLISEEQRWCKRAFAVTWLDIPVTTGSRYARRFCALGAIKRAGHELGLPVNEASRALEWQTVRPVPDWNDDKVRTHAEVVAAFDAAIITLL
jgi:hypothetical protein